MAIPPTARRLGKTLDPRDVKDVVIDFRPMLQLGEKIASFVFTLSAEAVAMGMSFKETGGYATAAINDDTGVLFWPVIDPSMQLDPAFDAGGISLALQSYVVTDSVPPREDEQTFLIPWAQK